MENESKPLAAAVAVDPDDQFDTSPDDCNRDGDVADVVEEVGAAAAAAGGVDDELGEDVDEDM